MSSRTNSLNIPLADLWSEQFAELPPLCLPCLHPAFMAKPCINK